MSRSSVRRLQGRTTRRTHCPKVDLAGLPGLKQHDQLRRLARMCIRASNGKSIMAVSSPADIERILAEDDREQAKRLLADLASIIMADALADGLSEAQAKLLRSKLASRVGSAWELPRWKQSGSSEALLVSVRPARRRHSTQSRTRAGMFSNCAKTLARVCQGSTPRRTASTRPSAAECRKR